MKYTNWRLKKKKRYKYKPLCNGENKKEGVCNGNFKSNGKIPKQKG